MKRLAKIRDLKQHFPHLMQETQKGNVWLYDSQGYTRELSTEDIQKIHEIEQDLKPYNGKVYAVLDSTLMIGSDLVDMKSFLIVTDEGTDIQQCENGTFYAFADVVNTSWGIEELGSILIREDVGRLVRVG